MVNHSSVAGGWPDELPIGTFVYMQGLVSGCQSGKIVANYKTIKHKDGIITKKQTAASYFTDDGDSGAPILFLKNGKYYICGIESCGNDKINYFSPSKNIVNELGISFVTSTVYVSGNEYK